MENAGIIDISDQIDVIISLSFSTPSQPLSYLSRCSHFPRDLFNDIVLRVGGHMTLNTLQHDFFPL